MFQHSSLHIRGLFLDKTHKLLKKHATSSRYACAFALASLDSPKDLEMDGLDTPKDLKMDVGLCSCYIFCFYHLSYILM